MIDLRSDTVTRPGRAMLEAMMAAPVGDDVYGDDPTVNELQRYAADLAGKEAALFLPTGTQANLVGLLSHCQRGEEYIVGQGAHNYLYEAGGAAVLGSIQPQPIDAAADGSLPLDKVAAKIKPDDIHFAPTRLLSLENTHNGKVLPRDYLQEAWAFTRQRDLALHVDGARIFNAVVAYGCELRDIAQYCDSFTICLSKGLGAPVGSLLLGSEAYIRRAIQPQPIDAAADGSLPLDKVAAKIKPDDIHFAPTRLLSLENTHNGKVLPRDYLQEAWAFTRQRDLALHVDGARIFNAVVAYGCELRDIAQYCDSFTICLSKGLGAPVGSLLLGSEAYIRRAIRWRKMVGGGMRQAGILAAAGLYALKNNVQRLQEDHDNAAWMAEQLRAIGADVTRHDTNMLFVRVGEVQAPALGEFMQARGVLINASPVVRLVTHLDVNRQQLSEVVAHWQAFLQR